MVDVCRQKERRIAAKKFSAVILNGGKDLTLANWLRRLPCAGRRLHCGGPSLGLG